MTVGTFKYTDFSELDSSVIRAAYYNADDSSLAIVFKNSATYVYNSVPYRNFSELIDSASPGREYASEIKGVFPSRYRTALFGLKFEPVEKEPFAEISDPEELPVQRYLIKGFVPASYEVSETSVEKAVERFRSAIAQLGYTDADIVVKEVTIKFE